MNKSDIYNYIKAKDIWFEITEHKAVFNMEELNEINLPYPESNAKNIFVRDDKKRNYYLITIKGSKKIDLKKFKQQNNTRHLSFASTNDLKEMINLTPGSVTPLGLLNDKEKKIIFYIDDYFTKNNSIIGVHPNDNTATIWLKTNDLIDIIKEHGNIVNIVEI